MYNISGSGGGFIASMQCSSTLTFTPGMPTLRPTDLVSMLKIRLKVLLTPYEAESWLRVHVALDM